MKNFNRSLTQYGKSADKKTEYFMIKDKAKELKKKVEKNETERSGKNMEMLDILDQFMYNHLPEKIYDIENATIQERLNKPALQLGIMEMVKHQNLNFTKSPGFDKDSTQARLLPKTKRRNNLKKHSHNRTRLNSQDRKSSGGDSRDYDKKDSQTTKFTFQVENVDEPSQKKITYKFGGDDDDGKNGNNIPKSPNIPLRKPSNLSRGNRTPGIMSPATSIRVIPNRRKRSNDSKKSGIS